MLPSKFWLIKAHPSSSITKSNHIHTLYFGGINTNLNNHIKIYSLIPTRRPSSTMDPPHASPTPSSSSMPATGRASTSASKLKKFKLDPMSMLLPHERPGYRGPPAAGRSMPPPHPQLQQQSQSGPRAYFAMLQNQQVPQDLATQRFGTQMWTTASAGGQGGKRGESSGSQTTSE